ncbi:MAG: hypothetical protein KA799_01360 [Bacteroidales bacterium]|nr:hypothetical protein [Bacteroidales bacterium]
MKYLRKIFITVFFLCFKNFLTGQINYFENNSIFLAEAQYNGYIKLFPNIELQKDTTHKWIKRKLFEENLISINDSIAKISINPFLDLSIGVDNGHQTQINFINTRGITFLAQISKNLYISSEFYENQAFLPEYYNLLIDSVKFLPGNNWVKDYRERGIDYGLAMGRIQWQATDWMTLETGFNTINLGNGFRNLILSNEARPYPYLHMVFNYRKKILLGNVTGIAYHNSQIIDNINDNLKNIFSVNYLTFYPLETLSISLIDLTIFHPSNGYLRFSPYTFIFVPEIRSILLRKKPSWSLPGCAFNIELPNNKIYYQCTFNIDDVIANNFKQNFAYQLGFCSNINLSDTTFLLSIRAEYNSVGEHAMDNKYPTTYPIHLYQPLGMWQGENFNELILQLNLLIQNNLLQIFTSYQNIKPSDINITNKLGNINSIYTSISYTYLINKIAGFGAFIELSDRIALNNDFYNKNSLGFKCGIKYLFRDKSLNRWHL